MKQRMNLPVGYLSVWQSIILLHLLVFITSSGSWVAFLSVEWSHLWSAEYFRRESRPKVLLTTNYKPSAIMYAFIADMLEVLPDATYYKRQVGCLMRPANAAAPCISGCQAAEEPVSQGGADPPLGGLCAPADLALLLQGFPLKKIVQYASNRGFTDLMVFNEDRKTINGVLVVHLPDGPTAHFKLSNIVLSKDIKVQPSL